MSSRICLKVVDTFRTPKGVDWTLIARANWPLTTLHITDTGTAENAKAQMQLTDWFPEHPACLRSPCFIVHSLFAFYMQRFIENIELDLQRQ